MEIISYEKNVTINKIIRLTNKEFNLYQIISQTITFANKNMKTVMIKINVELEIIVIIQARIKVLHITHVI